MNSAALIIALAAVVGGCIPIIIIAVKKSQAEKAAEKQLEKVKENEIKKNEAKEKMETGNSKSDFDASVSIMHKLSSRK